MTNETTTSSGSVQHSKDVLVADLKRVVSDADDLMKEVVNSTSEEFAAARHRIEARLGAVRARIEDARTATARSVCGAASSAEAFVKENPWTVIGAASAVGVIATCLLINRACKHGNE